MAARHHRPAPGRNARAAPPPSKDRQHLMLVPGFGGFDALGSLRYYHGVMEVLEELRDSSDLGEDSDLAVHYFPNLPTASVELRALQLQRWLKALYDRRVILPGDSLHLIGHSTGGLDLRQLLTNLRMSKRAASGGWPPVVRIASVQFLSTPHFGTTLAYHLSRTWPRRVACRTLLLGAYQVLRGLGEPGAARVGRVGKWVTNRARTPDWIDAILDTLSGSYTARDELERAAARGAYFTLLRWLLDMGSDFNAITDLDPYLPPPGAPTSPAHQDEDSRIKDLEFLERQRIRVRSIVTRAPPPLPSLPPWALYALSYGLTAARPPERFRELTVRELFNPRRKHTLRPSDNDGFVNSVSQVWPAPHSSFLVEGDHADVIGHYRSPPAERTRDFFKERQYDLLGSPSAFNWKTFRALWREMARFALELPAERLAERGQASRPVLESPAPSLH